MDKFIDLVNKILENYGPKLVGAIVYYDGNCLKNIMRKGLILFSICKLQLNTLSLSY